MPLWKSCPLPGHRWLGQGDWGRREAPPDPAYRRPSHPGCWEALQLLAAPMGWSLRRRAAPWRAPQRSCSRRQGWGQRRGKRLHPCALLSAGVNMESLYIVWLLDDICPHRKVFLVVCMTIQASKPPLPSTPSNVHVCDETVFYNLNSQSLPSHGFPCGCVNIGCEGSRRCYVYSGWR